MGVEKLYRIGELAKLAGVNKSAIDHYTRLGLVAPSQRSEGKYRLYSQTTLERIRFIRKCQDKRLSLAEIQEAMKGEISTERADIGLCMTHASLAIDEALRELRNVGDGLGDVSEPDTTSIGANAAVLMLKVAALSELLQILMMQI